MQSEVRFFSWSPVLAHLSEVKVAGETFWRTVTFFQGRHEARIIIHFSTAAEAGAFEITPGEKDV